MKRKWWHDKVAYEIYPKSFYDTNGDGIGDLRGVIAKLDYLKDLGIDIIWLCPIYQSPFVDQGYDVSDYYRIAEEFGTMEQFDELLAEVKKREMYLIMDLILNHCSNQHEWFQKALENPECEEAGYFYFQEGKDGKPPSNYRSYFGESTWESVPGTDKYYLHMFAKEQPDFNWTNPKLRRKLYDMVNWWLDKGVAGFRVDAVINIKKDISFPSFEPDGADGLCACTKLIEASDGIGEYLQELKRETFEKYDAFTVGEVCILKEGMLNDFIGEKGYLSSIFDFSAQELLGRVSDRPPDFTKWREVLIASQKEAGEVGFQANIIENHDGPRGTSAFLPDYLQNDKGKKMLGAISMLMRGIPFVYQGQEIGMTNCIRKSIDEYDDISTLKAYQCALDAGETAENALAFCGKNSRDNGRTPMQWNMGKNAGFTEGTPWLALNSNYTEINLEAQRQNPDSVFCFYKKLIALRKKSAYRGILVYGSFRPVFMEMDRIFAYERVEEGGNRILVAGNFGREMVELPLNVEISKLLLSNTDRVKLTARKLTLAGGELAVVLFS